MSRQKKLSQERQRNYSGGATRPFYQEKKMSNDIMPATLTLKIQSWDYQQSVDRIRPKVINWKNFTTEMAREFWFAKEHIKLVNSTPQLREGSNCRSWGDYCTEIGLNRRSVDAWLSCFIPAELSEDGKDHLNFFSPESSEDRKLKQVGRIEEFRRTGTRPDDWQPEDDAELRRQAGEDKAVAEAHKFVSILNYKQQFKPKYDYFADMMARSKDIQTFKLSTRDLREIQQQAFDGVTEYLHSFKDMNDRAKAAMNLSYKLRQLVNDCMEALAQEHQAQDEESKTIEPDVVIG